MSLYRTSLLEERTEELVDQVARLAYPLEESDDLDPLLEQIGEARYVLLGEASHGTSDYYLWRARLSRRLIREKGFSFIAVEGDWPDCYSVNRYIKGYAGAGESAQQVLHAFERWPTWMWANWEIVALAEWLRQHNEGRAKKAGFYGLDVYSLWESMHSIIDYLQEIDPEAAKAAQRAYMCFEPYGEDVQAYAWATTMVPTNCEEEVIQLLSEVRNRVQQHPGDPEAIFNAEQNALVMVNAERYYRAMVRGGADSWNLRDQHMFETLERLMNYHGPGSKAIIWAHNTHIGDARFTDMRRAGMFNIGQLVREQREAEGVVLVGFGSHRGEVIAGREWGAPMERLRVPLAQQGSWEDIMHRAGEKNKLLLMPEARAQEGFLDERGHRAIGVVYRPDRERYGNYVPTNLPLRYDAFLYIDESQALHPLHLQPKQDGEPPETYPWGL